MFFWLLGKLYWLGREDSAAFFQCNELVRLDVGDGFLFPAWPHNFKSH